MTLEETSIISQHYFKKLFYLIYICSHALHQLKTLILGLKEIEKTELSPKGVF